MVGCGLRRGEVAGLRWRDLNFDDGTIFVRGRGDHERMVGMPMAVRIPLRRLADEPSGARRRDRSGHQSRPEDRHPNGSRGRPHQADYTAHPTSNVRDTRPPLRRLARVDRAHARAREHGHDGALVRSDRHPRPLAGGALHAGGDVRGGRPDRRQRSLEAAPCHSNEISMWNSVAARSARRREPALILDSGSPARFGMCLPSRRDHALHTYLTDGDVDRPPQQGTSPWPLRSLTAVTTIFGRNGSGKSSLLRAIRSEDPEHRHYVCPERGGEISVDPTFLLDQADPETRAGRSDTNYIANYQSQIKPRIQTYFFKRSGHDDSDQRVRTDELVDLLAPLFPDFKLRLVAENHPFDLI